MKGANNAVVSGVVVTASVNSGNGKLAGTMTVNTDASGVATFNNIQVMAQRDKDNNILTDKNGAELEGIGNHTLKFTVAGATITATSNFSM